MRAFSLPQLAATCCCVAILILMAAVPSLRSVAKLSRHEQCLQRLGAIGQASQIYSISDVAESAIPVHGLQFDFRFDEPVGAYEWGGKSGIGRDDFWGYPSPENSRYGTRAGIGPATRPLNNILYPHGFRNHAPGAPFDLVGWNYNREGAIADASLPLDAYRCPGDDGPPLAAHCSSWVENPAQTSFDHFGTSFVANTYSNSFSYDTVFSNSPYLRKRSAVPNPARTIHYQENIGRWAWAARRVPDGCNYCCIEGIDPGPAKAIRGWHGRDWTYNHVFIDGHAEKKQIYVDGTENSQGEALHRQVEEMTSCPPTYCCAPGNQQCIDSATPTECQFNYECTMVRGDGWQIDTMPAPFICTGRGTIGYRPAYEGCVRPPDNAAGKEARPHELR